MKKKAYLMKPALLLSASAALLLLSTVGSTRAALTYYSENYAVEVTVSSIGVSLLENGETVSSRNYDGSQWKESTGELLTGMLKEGEAIVPGRPYEESLSVANSGAIDSYVRVNLYRSWQDANGETDTMLSPELIDLSLNLEGSGWVEDTSASTPERLVLYYTKPLLSGQAAPAFCDALRIDPAVATKVKETTVEEHGDHKTITTTYAYDGYQLKLEAEVDAVQTHNAQDAIKSAWGVDVEVGADGTLRLR